MSLKNTICCFLKSSYPLHCMLYYIQTLSEYSKSEISYILKYTMIILSHGVCVWRVAEYSDLFIFPSFQQKFV